MPWEVVEREGNETMKRLMNKEFNSPEKETTIYHEQRRRGDYKIPGNEVLFYCCFGYPDFVRRKLRCHAPGEIIAIAAVHLFFKQANHFEASVKLMEVHDAISSDFKIETEREKTGEKCEFANFFNLTKTKQTFNFILTKDIIEYFNLYKAALQRS